MWSFELVDTDPIDQRTDVFEAIRLMQRTGKSARSTKAFQVWDDEFRLLE